MLFMTSQATWFGLLVICHGEQDNYSVMGALFTENDIHATLDSAVFWKTPTLKKNTEKCVFPLNVDSENIYFSLFAIEVVTLC